MKRSTVPVLLALASLFVSSGHAFAYGRGGGGGFRAGGASVSGYHAAAVGGVRGGEVGGYRAGEVSTARGGAVGGYRTGEVGGYRAGEVGGYRTGEVGGYRAGAVGVHTSVATDFGQARVGSVGGTRGFVAAGHSTTAYSSSVLASRGVAVRGGFYHYGTFNTAWWGSHPGAWRPVGWAPGRVWGWATWPTLTTWFGWSAQPVYYDYGNTIVLADNQVYIDNQPGPSAAEYYQQAADLALSAPPPEKTEEEWQPLGVFSLVQGEQSDTSAVFELAVNKAGIIRGNYSNVLTDTTLPVQGAVDKKTQRASWIVGDQKTTVYDTGIANLTRDESPVLIHFGKDRTQQWLLVRIKEADSKAQPAPVDVNPPATGGDGTAQITLLVPADAEVSFDGSPSSKTGTERVYVTPQLEKDASYSYSIRAVWTEDGKPIDRTRKVSFKAGSKVRVDMTSPIP